MVYVKNKHPRDKRHLELQSTAYFSSGISRFLCIKLTLAEETI